MGRSRGFGSIACDLTAIFRLAFASAPVPEDLSLAANDNSPAHYAKGTPSPIPLRAYGFRPLVSVWFQVLLTPLIAVLFIVQSPYLFTIGHRGVFSLGRWSARLHTEFHESVLLWYASQRGFAIFAYGTFTLYGRTFQTVRLSRFVTHIEARNPGTTPGLGYSAFARRY